MPVDPDPYAALGVAPTASDDELRHAYRELARRFHPDRAAPGDAPTAQRMTQINAAWSLVGDPTRRAAWDRAAQQRAANSGSAAAGAQHPGAHGATRSHQWGFEHERADLDDLDGPDADRPVRRPFSASGRSASGPSASSPSSSATRASASQTQPDAPTLARAVQVIGVVLIAVCAPASLYLIGVGARGPATITVFGAGIGLVLCALSVMRAMRPERPPRR